MREDLVELIDDAKWFITRLNTNGRKLTEDYYKDLIVVSYNEVDSGVNLTSVGMVTA